MLQLCFKSMLLMGGLCVASPVLADETGGWSFAGSGFLTVATGKMLGGTRGPVLDKQCPCFVADYAQNAIYDGRSGLQFAPDSKLGLQGTATLPDPRFSLTVQGVSRASQNGSIDME